MGIPISWDVSPFSLGYVSCILIKPRWSSRESAYPSTSIACRFSMRSLWLGVKCHRSPSKKGPSYVFIQDLVDVFTIISRIFQVSNFSDPIWGVSFYILHIDNMSRLMICQWKNHQKRRIYQTNMGRTGALTKWNWLAKGVHQLAVCDVKTFDWSDCDPSRRLPLGAFGNQSFSDAEHESYLNWWWINHQHPLNPYYNTY